MATDQDNTKQPTKTEPATENNNKSILKTITSFFTGDSTPEETEEKGNGVTELGSVSTDFKVDFFEIYNLSPHMRDSRSIFGGFMPAVITDAKYSEESASLTPLDETTSKIKIVIPLKPQEIQDGVSVSFGRKNADSFTGNIKHWVAGKLVGDTSSTLDKIAEQFLTIDYKSDSLKKEVSFDFLLPLTNIKPGELTKEKIIEIRKALSILQSTMYPISVFNFVPQLLKLRIGHIYRGFKGFISSVDYSFSEEMVTDPITGIVWPLIITGKIKFINIFAYLLEGNDIKDAGITEDFNLSKEPQLLFGVHTAGGSGGSGLNSSSKPGEGNFNNTSLITDASPSQKSTLMEETKASSTPNQITNNLPTINPNATTNKMMENITDEDVFSLNSKYMNNYSETLKFGNGNGDFLGFNSDYDLSKELSNFNPAINYDLNSAQNVANKIGDITTASDLSDLIGDIKNNKVLNDISKMANLANTAINIINDSNTSITSMINCAANALDFMGIDSSLLKEAGDLYRDYDFLKRNIENLNTSNIPIVIDTINSILYTITSQINTLAKMSNNINNTVNERNAN